MLLRVLRGTGVRGWGGDHTMGGGGGGGVQSRKPGTYGPDFSRRGARGEGGQR